LAGAGIKAIKTRMISVESTKQITKAMKLVSTSKLRKAKEKAESADPYFNALKDTVQDIARATKGVNNVFMQDREAINRCFIVIAGDRGLAGGYNSNVFKEAMTQMLGEKERIIAIGSKSYEYFSKRKYEIVRHVDNVETCTYDDVADIADTVMEMYKNNEIDEVSIIYTKFRSALVQEVKCLRLLPLLPHEIEPKEKKSSSRVQYLPSPDAVLSHIVPNYLRGMIYGGVVESFASEQGARRTAMESATDNADEMISKLELSYNRARQTAVTQEITEIVGGVEALK
jgi:F-type H+-transporting ATPase subunit gamma